MTGFIFILVIIFIILITFSDAGISTFFCAAVGIACLLVCLRVGLVMTAGGEA